MRAPILSLVVVFTVGAAWAAPVSAQFGRMARARAAFERGQTAFEAEDYVGAREGFQEAYQLTENPAIRYNLGLVEERVGNLEAAAEHFRFYVSRASAEEDLAAGRSHLAAVESQLEARRVVEPGAVGPNEPSSPQEPSPVVSPAPRERGLGWAAFAGTLGAGLAVAAGLGVGSGVLWADANTRFDAAASCAPTCSDTVVQEIDAAISASNALWIAALSVGVVGAGLATVLLFSAASGDESVAVRVSPLGVFAEGRFQ